MKDSALKTAACAWMNAKVERTTYRKQFSLHSLFKGLRDQAQVRRHLIY